MNAKRFLGLPPARRALIFEQAAAALGLSPVILEKDFWVCWLLGIAFAEPALGPHLVFKGGTSLSKVFNVIDRFSEDVDLSVSPRFVGFDEVAFNLLKSRTQRDAAVVEMQRLCDRKAQSTIRPELERAIRDHLGPPTETSSWLTYDLDLKSASAILYFNYPAARSTDFAYLRRAVKLELGTLTDQQPVGRYPIRPWVADTFPEIFSDWTSEVAALHISRTFWEKATILHAEHHRPADQPTPDRYARHYSDFGRLLQHPDAQSMLADSELCDRVVVWKSKVFARSWANYAAARHGTFKLVPPEHRRNALAKDYAEMRPMFLAEPVPFGRLMDQLAAVEATMNSAAHGL
jgi:hypothetical protein